MVGGAPRVVNAGCIARGTRAPKSQPVSLAWMSIRDYRRSLGAALGKVSVPSRHAVAGIVASAMSSDHGVRRALVAASLLGTLVAALPVVAFERLQTHGRRLGLGARQVLALTDPVAERVQLYDVSGVQPRKLGEFGEQGVEPGQWMGVHGALLLASGELVVADTFNHRVLSFDGEAATRGLGPRLLRVWGAAGAYVGNGLDGPLALVATPGPQGPQAPLYVADTRKHRVLVLGADARPTGLVLGGPGEEPGHLGWPVGLAFDTDGRTLYVAEEWTARVSAFDAATGRLLFIYQPGGADVLSPGGLATTANGDVLVTDRVAQSVVRLRPQRDGGGRPRALTRVAAFPTRLAGTQRLAYPQAVAADAAGRIYVCERLDGRCARYAADGAFLGTFGDDGEALDWAPPVPDPGLLAPGPLVRCHALGTYEMRIALKPGTPPLNEPFEAEVELRRGCGTAAVSAEGVSLRLGGWMPEHRHGMVSEPRVLADGPGRFRVQGLLFHMAGVWELRVDVVDAGVLTRMGLDLRIE